jgi:hypothetical protein
VPERASTPNIICLHFPAEREAALRFECFAVVGTIVNEEGVAKLRPQAASEDPKSPPGSSLFSAPTSLEQMIPSQAVAQSANVSFRPGD